MFKTKQVKTKTLGEYLISLRGRLGLGIVEVSKVAKIPPKYLSSLEQGDYTKLPAAVYVRGFLKTLAEIYQIDTGPLLTLYEAEKNLSDQLVAGAPGQTQSKRAVPNFVFSPRTLTVTAVILLGCASLGYLYFQLNSVRKSPPLEVFSPSEDGLTNSSFLSLEGRTEPGSNVYLNNQPVVVDSSGKFHENLSLAPGMNQLIIKAMNKFGKETIITRKIVIAEKQVAGVLDTPTTTPNTIEPNELSLEILVGPNASWMSIEVDSQDVFTGTMLPGSSRMVKGQFVKLSTTNAGSARVILDGQDLGILGKEGETLRDVEFSK